MSTMASTPARKGLASRTRAAVTSIDQTKSGSRNQVMPGARIVIVVTRKLIAPTTEEMPRIWTPRIQRSVPWPGRKVFSVSGGYSVQPAWALPPDWVRSPLYMVSPPSGISQKESALIRGNAMSRAPIISGTK